MFIRNLFIAFLSIISSIASAEINIEDLSKVKWLQLESKNFIVITDANQKLGNVLIRDLENFRFFIAYALGSPLFKGNKPLKILAIHNSGTFKDLNFSKQLAGIFLKRMSDDYAIASISDYSLSENTSHLGDHVLLHEYVHFVTRNELEMISYPLWYSEGEAEYLATFRFSDEGKSVSVGSMSVIGDRLSSLLKPFGRGFRKVDVEDLFKTKNMHLGWRREDKDSHVKREDKSLEFYARAMITYHYLQSSRELQVQKARYLKLINEGRTVDKAFEMAFSMSYADMDKEIERYASSKRVTGWKLDVGKSGLSFPQVNISVESLTSAKAVTQLTSFISQVKSKKREEIQSLFDFARKHGEHNAVLMLAELDWSVSKGRDISGLMSEARNKYPQDLDLQAMLAYLEKERIEKAVIVGHPTARRELTELRSRFRQILRKDPYNRLAYFGLGELLKVSDEDNPDLIKEAAIVLDSAKLLMNESFRETIIENEIQANSLLKNADAVLLQKYQLAAVSDSDWIETGYGRFVLEMLRMRSLTLALGDGDVEGDIIRYKNGAQYTGVVKNGIPGGQGKLLFEGNELKGVFSAGNFLNQGELTTANGYHYKGQFSDGVITGQGELVWPADKNIIRQHGSFLMGQEHGAQEIMMSNGDVIKGMLKMGLYHGNINVAKKDGTKLQREYYLGHMRYKLNESLVYAGGWNENYLPHGKGLCYHIDLNAIRPCQYKNGQLKNEVNVQSDLTLAH